MDPKPQSGLVSSEFIAAITSMAGVILGAVPDKYVPLVGGIVGLYVACRTLLKVVHVLGYAKQVPDLPAVPDGFVRNTIITESKK